VARILIVDDDPDVRTYLSTFLGDSGYDTCVAEDGELGLQKAIECKPDLITLDIIMPNQTGVKMYRTMRADETLKDIPIIIVSGVTRYKELFARSHKTLPKPDGFLEKPVDRDTLLASIQKLIPSA